MEKQIVILANSWRDGGRCIAGKCTKTGEWIRPIYGSDNEAISETEVTDINLRDVVKINIKSKCPDKYQCENYLIDSSAQNNWEVIYKASLPQIEKLCEPSTQILHSKSARTHINQVIALPEDKRKSLTLIQANINFIPEQKEGVKKWRGYFSEENTGYPFGLPITDPKACDTLDHKPSIREVKCILTISLAKPWGEQREYCYKLIAGVIWADKYQESTFI